MPASSIDVAQAPHRVRLTINSLDFALSLLAVNLCTNELNARSRIADPLQVIIRWRLRLTWCNASFLNYHSIAFELSILIRVPDAE